MRRLFHAAILIALFLLAQQLGPMPLLIWLVGGLIGTAIDREAQP